MSLHNLNNEAKSLGIVNGLSKKTTHRKERKNSNGHKNRVEKYRRCYKQLS